MRAFACMAACAAVACPASVLAQGLLENPSNGSVEAGVSAITGWHCTSRQIEIRIDGRSIGNAGVGTPRADTTGQCGRSDTGFSLLYNFALLRGGAHRVDAYADGQLFGTATIQAAYLGAEFMRGLSSAHEIQDFPEKGQKARIVWSQGKQDFVVSGSSPALSGSLVGTYSIRLFTMLQVSGSSLSVASSLKPGVSLTGTMSFNGDGSYSMLMTMSGGGAPQSFTWHGVYSDAGYYMFQDGDGYAIVERGETLTIQNLSVIPDANGQTTYSLVMSMNRTDSKESGEPWPAQLTVLAPGRAWPEVARALFAATGAP